MEFIDGASTGSVSVAGTVSPSIFIINNSALAYTFSGAGNISGGVALTKEGTGTLAMNMAGNTYSGGTGMGGGVLQIGANSGVPLARWPRGRWAPARCPSAAAPCRMAAPATPWPTR